MELPVQVQTHLSKSLFNSSPNMPNVSYKRYTMRQVFFTLKLPRLDEYCCGCMQYIQCQYNRMTCQFCCRSVHEGCRNKLIDGKHGNTNCRFCRIGNCCLQCNIVLGNNPSIISCSICPATIHIQCYSLPLELFEMSHCYFKKIYGKQFDSKKTVCQGCRKVWLMERRVITTRIDTIKYGFYQLSHPSSVHYFWKREEVNALEENQMEIEDEVIEVGQVEDQIQTIFSIFVCPNFQQSTLQEAYNHCVHGWNKVLSINKQYYFLVKYRNSSNVIWQDDEMVRPNKQLLKNFFNNLMITLVFYIEESVFQTKYITTILLDQLYSRQNNKKNIKVIGSAFSKHASKYKKIEKDVLHYYDKRSKQSIKAKGENDSFRMEVLGRLINTIMFQRYKLQPVIIITEGRRAQWWNKQLQKQCPCHTILRLSNSKQYLKTIMRHHFYSYERKRCNFNILIIQNQSFANIDPASLIIFVNNTSLLILDENAVEEANEVFKTAQIAKIKLTGRGQEEWNSQSDMRVTKNSSYPSSSTPSSINQFRVNEKKALRKQKRNKKQHIANVLTEKWNVLETIFNNPELYKVVGLDQMQRVIFLRFILAFGLNFQSSLDLTFKLQHFQSSFISSQNLTDLVKVVNEYLLSFLSVTHHILHNTKPIQKQIQKYYLFNFEAAEIIKRIVFLKKLNNLDLSPNQNQSKTLQSNTIIQNSIDFKICEAVLNKGFGRWKEVSEYAKIWEKDLPEMSLRTYICSKGSVELISSDHFQKIIEKRMLKIIEDIQFK